jgi:DNA-binding FadR family transcriptional regulator
MVRHTKRDVAFHSLLLEMTGSALIAGMQRVLVDFFQTHAAAADPPPDATLSKRIVGDHIALAEAIRDRDVQRARSILGPHLRQYLPAS